MWLNDNAGILVLIIGIVAIALLGVILFLVFSLRSRFAVQRLRFVGLYATDVETRRAYASLTVGNRSVSEITALYRKKAGLDERARIVIEQRHSIDFTLTVEELSGVLIDGEKGKRLKTLRLYALDLMGNLYQGRIGAVKKLLSASLTGKLPAPVPSSAPPAVQEGAAAQVSASAPEEERGSEDTTGDEEGIEE